MQKIQLLLLLIVIVLSKESSFETDIFWNLVTSKPN